MKMAQQQAPPAAQAPIVVVVDEVQITSDKPGVPSRCPAALGTGLSEPPSPSLG